jgi:phosphate transport system substrate-binding protein
MTLQGKLMTSNRKNGAWLTKGLGTLALGTVLAGCGGSPNGETSAPEAAQGAADNAQSTVKVERLTGAGATFPYPIYSKWFDAYKNTKGVEINYQSVGSGAGIKQLANQTVDFGASDAPLKDDEIKKMPSPVVHIPTVAGAVVLAYNLPGAPSNLKLDGKAIAGIYLGSVKKWNDPAISSLNAGAKLPSTPIVVAHRSDGSGTSYIFTNYLATVSPSWKSKVGAGKSVDWPVGLGGKGNDGVAGIVKQAPGGIGYVELAYAKQNKLPYAMVKNAAGQFIVPDVESVTAAAQGASAKLQQDIRASIVNSAGAKAYPIAGFTYILAYTTQKDADKGQSLKDFLKWAMEDGQGMASALDYAPLPTDVVAINEKAIDSIR